jgi:hypothetical protein
MENAAKTYGKVKMTLHQRAYYQAFVISLLICWSPIKILAYTAPFIALAWFIFVTKSSIVLRNFLIWLFLFIALISLHVIFNFNFILFSAIVAIFTYSSFSFIFAIPNQHLAGLELLRSMFRLIQWVVLFEGALGILQAIYGFTQNKSFDVGNGDFVQGTINLSFTSGLAFSNPMYAVNITFFLLGLFTFYILERKGFIPFLVGCLALILASVVHVLVFLFTAILLVLIIFRPAVLKSTASLVVISFLLIVVPTLSFFVLYSNFQSFSAIYEGTAQGNSPRVQVTDRVFSTLPMQFPLMPFVGLGPGQFSSRAALIGTGLYFGGPNDPSPLPFPKGMSKALETDLLDLWLIASATKYYGSTQQPFYSWLSVYTELGAPVFIVILAFSSGLVVKVKSKVETYEQEVMAIAFSIGVIFLFLLGLQENYWEVPQAIFLGTMLLKALYASIVYPNKRPVRYRPGRIRKVESFSVK